MTVSVVIPNLDSPIIDQVVSALQAQTQPVNEIIVVGQDRAGRVPPEVRFVRTPVPVAAATARNLGAEAASSDYLLFIDSDCIAAPDLVAQLTAAHAQGYTVVGGSVALEPAAYWTLCDNLLVFAPFLNVAPRGPRTFLPSLNLSVRREVFATVGGFDQRLPGAAGEDVDLSVRLREAGHLLFFAPEAVISHRPQRSSARAIWQHLRFFGRVHLLLTLRHGAAVSEHAAAQRRHATAPDNALIRLRPWTTLIQLAAPVLALRDVAKLYGSTPALVPFWRAIPGMTWGKIAWYWGLTEALLALKHP